eukprot:16438343-Heterocapsa_arctica.AAC.1
MQAHGVSGTPLPEEDRIARDWLKAANTPVPSGVTATLPLRPWTISACSPTRKSCSNHIHPSLGRDSVPYGISALDPCQPQSGTNAARQGPLT